MLLILLGKKILQEKEHSKERSNNEQEQPFSKRLLKGLVVDHITALVQSVFACFGRLFSGPGDTPILRQRQKPELVHDQRSQAGDRNRQHDLIKNINRHNVRDHDRTGRQIIRDADGTRAEDRYRHDHENSVGDHTAECGKADTDQLG